MAEKLFTEFPPVSTEKWEEVINKDLKGADYEKRLVWKTEDGFPLRPYYRAEDLSKIGHIDNKPAVFPFVRGTKCDNNWLVRQDYCAHESYSKANKEALDGLMRGVEAVGFCIDGNKPISYDDMKTLLDGIVFTATEVNFTCCYNSTYEIISNFLAVAEEKVSNKSDIKASFDFDPLRGLTTKGYFCDDNAFDTAKKLIDLVKDYPNIRVIGVEAYAFNDAGATISQELAFALAMGSEYMNQLTSRGVSADEVAKRIQFTFAVGSSYFLEIGKFRAARMLWANIVKAYGAKEESSEKMRIHAVTSEWNQTIYDPYVNMLRGTTEAMSAALAGVDSLEVLPFDYSFREPNTFGNRIARNTQIILKEESHFDKVVDPGAGSYYIETITDSTAKVVWNLFNAVEEAGGYIESFKAGFVQGEIKRSSEKRDQNIANRRMTILGTNQFPNFNEVSDKEITLDMVKRSGIPSERSKPRIAEPLEKYRGAQAFEALRYSTDRSGKTPMVFMLTFGNLAMCRARAQFSSNFFAVAGFKVVDNNRFATIEEGVEAAVKAKAEIVVACSSDDEYTEAVPRIAELLGDRAILVVAGDPASKDELISKGIGNFINVKSNVLETLKDYQKKLGIKSL